jgi:lipopolysaccharide export system protein LptC
VNSDEHVDVKLTNGTLSADRLRITEGGAVLRFEGNVVMNLDHLDSDNENTQSANAAPAEQAASASVQPVKPRQPSGKSANPK